MKTIGSSSKVQIRNASLRSLYFNPNEWLNLDPEDVVRLTIHYKMWKKYDDYIVYQDTVEGLMRSDPRLYAAYISTKMMSDIYRNSHWKDVLDNGGFIQSLRHSVKSAVGPYRLRLAQNMPATVTVHLKLLKGREK